MKKYSVLNGSQEIDLYSFYSLVFCQKKKKQEKKWKSGKIAVQTSELGTISYIFFVWNYDVDSFVLKVGNFSKIYLYGEYFLLKFWWDDARMKN